MTDIGMVPGTLLFIVLAIFGCMALFFTWNHRNTVRLQIALFLVAFCNALCLFYLGLSVWTSQQSSTTKTPAGGPWACPCNNCGCSRD